MATTRVLGSLLYGVQPADIATFASMSATMILIGLLATYLPARRASAVDPIESLRNDECETALLARRVAAQPHRCSSSPC